MRTGIAGLMVIVFLILAGCGDKNSVPSGILPKEKMQEVMWDMIMADQYAVYLAKDSAHLDMKLEHLRLYEQVFRLHDVSRDEFRKSYAWYSDHPELNQILFDSMSNSGSRLRTEIYSHPVVRPVTTPPPAPVITPRVTTPALLRSPLTPLKTPLKRDTAQKNSRSGKPSK